MEAALKNSPTRSHFLAVTNKWQLTAPIQFIRRVANFVYDTKRENESLIVRMTASDYRSHEQLAAELEWASHLEKCGARVAAPVRSKDNELIEVVTHDSLTFYVSVFKKAPGQFIQFPKDFNPTVFRLWGKAIATMHLATESFVPQGKGRPHWCEDTMFNETLAGFEFSDEKELRDIFKKLLATLHAKPKTPDIYNLIHADLHPGNFFYDGSDLTFFDLDDSNYHWLAYDFGVALANIFSRFDRRNLKLDRAALLGHMLEGYVQIRPLPPHFEPDAMLFTTYRIALVYFWSCFHIRQGLLGQDVLEGMKPYLAWAKEELTR